MAERTIRTAFEKDSNGVKRGAFSSCKGLYKNIGRKRGKRKVPGKSHLLFYQRGRVLFHKSKRGVYRASMVSRKLHRGQV